MSVGHAGNAACNKEDISVVSTARRPRERPAQACLSRVGGGRSFQSYHRLGRRSRCRAVLSSCRGLKSVLYEIYVQFFLLPQRALRSACFTRGNHSKKDGSGFVDHPPRSQSDSSKCRGAKRVTWGVYFDQPASASLKQPSHVCRFRQVIETSLYLVYENKRVEVAGLPCRTYTRRN